MSERFGVVGARGHAKVVVSTLHALGHADIEVFDDDQTLWGTRVLGVPVVGPPIQLRASKRVAVIAIGNNTVRKRLAAELALPWATVVHPHAWVHSSAQLGPGSVVFAGAIVQPDVSMGAHCIVNTGASIDHDCQIADFAHIAPGVRLCGGVIVGEGALLGVGAALRPGVRVGDWSVVGAGAACTRDVPANVTVVGVPARIQVK